MYLCFLDDDKRSAFPEDSLISVDENGFTLKAAHNARTGASHIFLKLTSFKGAVPNFGQAIKWVKEGPPAKAAAPQPVPDNPSF